MSEDNQCDASALANSNNSFSPSKQERQNPKQQPITAVERRLYIAAKFKFSIKNALLMSVLLDRKYT